MIFNRLFAASAVAALIATPLAAISFAGGPMPGSSTTAEAVEIMPGAFDFPVPGEFLSDGRPANAPEIEHLIPRPISMMKYQVSQAEYQRCVDAGACKAADATISADADIRPITGVNYLDAQAYAAWYSRETGMRWRLPSDAEWAYAAAERFAGESYSAVAADPKNPAVAWIRRYREEAAARRQPDPHARSFGHFGPNSRGIVDLGGNVWEWTSTCYARTALAAETREIVHRTENCGVHIAAGRHRAYLSNFIRDGKSGGCAVGTPPENLGFRLVRDEKPTLSERLLDALRSKILRGPVS